MACCDSQQALIKDGSPVTYYNYRSAGHSWRRVSILGYRPYNLLDSIRLSGQRVTRAVSLL
jgi:hypothetical protein